MAVPKEFIEELKLRVPVPEVAGRQLRLIRRGRDTVALCPFHQEKTPSFHVYADHFHCFGCGAHGTVVDFVMRTESLSFRDAMARLAALAGLAMPRETAEEAARDRRRRSLQDAASAAAAIFHKFLFLPEGRPALDYLRRRGVADGTIADHGLGFAPDSRDRLKADLCRDGFNEDVLIEAGLVIAPDGGGASYDRFRGRAMFPIADRLGRIAGFGGRLLGQGEPKYLNSPEGPLFHKGRLLYGLDRAAKLGISGGDLIVVEGYMDVIGLVQAGFGAVVAPLGTALTDEQIAELWRVSPAPVLCFDGDKAGERAALRAAEKVLPLLTPGLSLRLARLPDGHDPDSLVAASGAGGFRRVLEAAEPLSRFLVRAATGDRPLSTPEARLAAWQRLKALAETITEPLVRREYRDAFYQAAFPAGDRHRPANAGSTRRTAGAPARGQGGFQTGGRRFPAPYLPAAGGVVPAGAVHAQTMPDGLRIAGRLLLAILLAHPDIFDAVEEDVGAVAFADSALDGLRQAVIALLSGADSVTADILAERLAAAGHGTAVAAVRGDPLVARHHGLAAASSRDAILALWRSEMQAFRRAALAEELLRARLETDDGGWRRRRMLTHALLADDE